MRDGVVAVDGRNAAGGQLLLPVSRCFHRGESARKERRSETGLEEGEEG